MSQVLADIGIAEFEQQLNAVVAGAVADAAAAAISAAFAFVAVAKGVVAVVAAEDREFAYALNHFHHQ